MKKLQKEDIMRFYAKVKPVFKKWRGIIYKQLKAVFMYLKNSWRSSLAVFVVFIFVYYSFGLWIAYKIDTDLTFKENETQGYQAVQIASDLIKRETDEHIFAPNLPFIFPIYISDNMPAFQKGIFESVKNMVRLIAVQHPAESVVKAKELLEYPSNVWLFSKTKDFKIAPSSVSQYRKARRNLLKFNEQIKISSNVLTELKSALSKDLADISVFLEGQIATGSFGKADDAFYEALGRLYADYLFLRTYRCEDCQSVNAAIAALEKAFELKPLFVQNGKLGRSFGANHLLELSYFSLKAHSLLSEKAQGEI